MLVALASATAIAILLPAGAPGIDDGCPSPRQVGDAVAAHLPGVVQPVGRPPGPGALRLLVTTDAGGALRVDLSDPDGGALLRRRVAPETVTRARPSDCLALAETAALIVDRYWHEVGYEVPAAPRNAPPPPPSKTPAQAVPKPPPPPPAPSPPAPTATEPPLPAPAVLAPTPTPPAVRRQPRAPLRPPNWWVALGGAAEIADRGPSHLAISLSVAVEHAVFGRRLGLRLSLTGLDPPERKTWMATTPSGTVFGAGTMTQGRVAMDAYVAFPVGLGRIEPGLGFDLGVAFIRSKQGNESQSPVLATPGVDALLAWTIPFSWDFFVRVLAVGSVVRPVQEMVDDTNPPASFNTPRLRGQLGLQFGFWFY